MLKIPVEHIIAKIKTEKGLPESEIQTLIETKYSQLAGLVSRDGAAHIVANELGVKVFDAGPSGPIKIKHVGIGSRNLTVVGRVMQVFEPKTFARADGTTGQLASFVLADETGSVRVVGWGNHADTIKLLESGVPLKLESAYTRENLRGFPELHLNDKSKMTINPNDVSIPEIAVQKKDPSRKDIKALVDGDQNVELLGTLIQIFDPTFYEVCPQCNKRVRANQEGVFVCEKHSAIKPAFSCVFNVYLDDGTGNTRCVFFQNQFERLVNKKMDVLIQLRDNPAMAEELKNALLGTTVKVVGKAQKNTLFDRLEFVVSFVYPEPDLQAEIERLQGILGKTG